MTLDSTKNVNSNENSKLSLLYSEEFEMRLFDRLSFLN